MADTVTVRIPTALRPQVDNHESLDLAGTKIILTIQRADRIIVMDAGKVVADGPREQVVEALRKGQVGRAN